jgi:hypothetical protein
MNGDLGQPIARGRTAKVYAGQEGQVLKLFYDWFALEDVEYEARIAGAIHANGLPVPSVGKVIRVNGRKIRRARGLPAPRRSKALAALENMPDAELDKVVENDMGTKRVIEHLQGFHWHETYHIGQLDIVRAFVAS